MKGTVQILICDEQKDSQGNIFRHEGVGIPDIPVTVALEFQENNFASILGRATLRMDAGIVYADLELLDSRMPEPSTEFLYPAPRVIVVERRGDVIYKCEIKSVGLSIHRHADPRVCTLAQQGMKP